MTFCLKSKKNYFNPLTKAFLHSKIVGISGEKWWSQLLDREGVCYVFFG
jgi:hypothetical protein